MMAVRAPFGEFGGRIDDVGASPFFKWFGLDPDGEERHLDGSVVLRFRPNGPAFHDLAELRVLAAADGWLDAVELRLSRSFVDDSRNGMFARDIAKSFLRVALDDRNLRSIGGLDQEIEWCGTFAVPILVRDPRPRIPPGSPTPPYRVFLGRDERYERILHGMRLLLENLSRPHPPLLRMDIAVRGLLGFRWCTALSRLLRSP